MRSIEIGSSHAGAAALLGGIAPRRFLAQHWQKNPLLVRGALPQFAGLLSPQELMALACRDDVRARLVIHRGRRWEALEGPFTRAEFRRLPPRGWSLLVHEVNHFFPEARALLDRFSFIPWARLDDLMISYAPAGGGVGPHFDSYDVFLLQGPGRRRWQISHQKQLRLLEGVPLKLLRGFRPDQEWTLDPGDMLYVPPGWAHHGVAVDACMTYSIGFRAPQWQELGAHFLRYLEDNLKLSGLYRDPRLKPQHSPARIARSMLDDVAFQLSRIRWTSQDVSRFLGEYLTEPKAHVFFSSPDRRLARAAFAEHAQSQGIALDLKSQMLYTGDLFFINGATVRVKGRARATLRRLADVRWLSTLDPTQRGLVTLLHEWYGAGYLRLGGARPPERRSK